MGIVTTHIFQTGPWAQKGYKVRPRSHSTQKQGEDLNLGLCASVWLSSLDSHTTLPPGSTQSPCEADREVGCRSCERELTGAVRAENKMQRQSAKDPRKASLQRHTASKDLWETSAHSGAHGKHPHVRWLETWTLFLPDWVVVNSGTRRRVCFTNGSTLHRLGIGKSSFEYFLLLRV